MESNQSVQQIAEENVVSKNMQSECPICFNPITGKNNCTTPCGHMFCFQCIAKALSNSTNCPCCRQELMENDENKSEDDDDIDLEAPSENDSDEDYDDEDDDDDDDLSIDLKSVGSIETIVERFTKMGYTLHDALMITVNRSSLTNSKYNDEYLNKLNDDFEKMLVDLDDETSEINQMMEEDERK